MNLTFAVLIKVTEELAIIKSIDFFQLMELFVLTDLVIAVNFIIVTI